MHARELPQRRGVILGLRALESLEQHPAALVVAAENAWDAERLRDRRLVAEKREDGLEDDVVVAEHRGERPDPDRLERRARPRFRLLVPAGLRPGRAARRRRRSTQLGDALRERRPQRFGYINFLGCHAVRVDGLEDAEASDVVGRDLDVAGDAEEARGREHGAEIGEFSALRTDGRQRAVDRKDAAARGHEGVLIDESGHRYARLYGDGPADEDRRHARAGVRLA